MDYDDLDDIVVLDSLGQLSIFYGKKTHEFTYQFIDHVFDFAFKDDSLFAGAVGFHSSVLPFPDLSKITNYVEKSEHEQIQSMLFTPVFFTKNESISPTSTQFLQNGFNLNTPLFDGDGSSLQTQTVQTYEELLQSY